MDLNHSMQPYESRVCAKHLYHVIGGYVGIRTLETSLKARFLSKELQSSTLPHILIYYCVTYTIYGIKIKERYLQIV
jgi:hypothetical protein